MSYILQTGFAADFNRWLRVNLEEGLAVADEAIFLKMGRRLNKDVKSMGSCCVRSAKSITKAV